MIWRLEEQARLAGWAYKPVWHTDYESRFIATLRWRELVREDDRHTAMYAPDGPRRLVVRQVT